MVGDDCKRIDGVAARLRHLVVVLVSDHPVDDDLFERNVGHEVHAHLEHAGHPEADDVVAGNQHARRIEPGQVFGFVGPAKRRERPEADENQVSSTSSSCTRSLLPHAGQIAGSVSATMTSPQMQYQAGIRWPHQSWRLMHQSRRFSIQRK